MPDNPFIVGQIYYSCGFGRASNDPSSPTMPIVETSVYLGVAKLECSSKQCDVPNHFHQFRLFGIEPSQLNPNAAVTNVPSLEHAKSLYTTWDEFIAWFEDLKQEKGWYEANERSGNGEAESCD